MDFKLITLATAGFLVLTSCATAPMRLYNRPGGTSEALLTDVETCSKIASDVHARAQYLYTNPKYGTAGAAGGAFGAGFAAGMEQARLHNEAFDNCLVSKNWTPTELTDAERAEFNKLPGRESKKAYIKTWMETHPVTSPPSTTANPVAANSQQ